MAFTENVLASRILVTSLPVNLVYHFFADLSEYHVTCGARQTMCRLLLHWGYWRGASVVCSNFLAIEDSSLRIAVADGSLVDEGYGSKDRTRQEPVKELRV